MFNKDFNFYTKMNGNMTFLKFFNLKLLTSEGGYYKTQVLSLNVPRREPSPKKSQSNNVKTMYVTRMRAYIYIHEINIIYIISLFLFIQLVMVFSIDLDLNHKIFGTLA